eukprot:jgi/Ulvmu1/3977/UM182_0005.1
MNRIGSDGAVQAEGMMMQALGFQGPTPDRSSSSDMAAMLSLLGSGIQPMGPSSCDFPVASKGVLVERQHGLEGPPGYGPLNARGSSGARTEREHRSQSAAAVQAIHHTAQQINEALPAPVPPFGGNETDNEAVLDILLETMDAWETAIKRRMHAALDTAIAAARADVMQIVEARFARPRTPSKPQPPSARPTSTAAHSVAHTASKPAKPAQVWHMPSNQSTHSTQVPGSGLQAHAGHSGGARPVPPGATPATAAAALHEVACSLLQRQHNASGEMGNQLGSLLQNASSPRQEQMEPRPVAIPPRPEVPGLLYVHQMLRDVSAQTQSQLMSGPAPAQPWAMPEPVEPMPSGMPAPSFPTASAPLVAVAPARGATVAMAAEPTVSDTCASACPAQSAAVSHACAPLPASAAMATAGAPAGCTAAARPPAGTHNGLVKQAAGEHAQMDKTLAMLSDMCARATPGDSADMALPSILQHAELALGAATAPVQGISALQVPPTTRDASSPTAASMNQGDHRMQPTEAPPASRRSNNASIGSDGAAAAADASTLFAAAPDAGVVSLASPALELPGAETSARQGVTASRSYDGPLIFGSFGSAAEMGQHAGAACEGGAAAVQDAASSGPSAITQSTAEAARCDRSGAQLAERIISADVRHGNDVMSTADVEAPRPSFRQRDTVSSPAAPCDSTPVRAMLTAHSAAEQAHDGSPSDWSGSSAMAAVAATEGDRDLVGRRGGAKAEASTTGSHWEEEPLVFANEADLHSPRDGPSDTVASITESARNPPQASQHADSAPARSGECTSPEAVCSPRTAPDDRPAAQSSLQAFFEAAMREEVQVKLAAAVIDRHGSTTVAQDPQPCSHAPSTDLEVLVADSAGSGVGHERLQGTSGRRGTSQDTSGDRRIINVPVTEPASRLPSGRRSRAGAAGAVNECAPAANIGDRLDVLAAPLTSLAVLASPKRVCGGHAGTPAPHSTSSVSLAALREPTQISSAASGRTPPPRFFGSPAVTAAAAPATESGHPSSPSTSDDAVCGTAAQVSPGGYPGSRHGDGFVGFDMCSPAPGSGSSAELRWGSPDACVAQPDRYGHRRASPDISCAEPSSYPSASAFNPQRHRPDFCDSPTASLHLIHHRAGGRWEMMGTQPDPDMADRDTCMDGSRLRSQLPDADAGSAHGAACPPTTPQCVGAAFDAALLAWDAAAADPCLGDAVRRREGAHAMCMLGAAPEARGTAVPDNVTSVLGSGSFCSLNPQSSSPHAPLLATAVRALSLHDSPPQCVPAWASPPHPRPSLDLLQAQHSGPCSPASVTHQATTTPATMFGGCDGSKLHEPEGAGDLDAELYELEAEIASATACMESSSASLHHACAGAGAGSGAAGPECFSIAQELECIAQESMAVVNGTTLTLPPERGCGPLADQEAVAMLHAPLWDLQQRQQSVKQSGLAAPGNRGGLGGPATAAPLAAAAAETVAAAAAAAAANFTRGTGARHGPPNGHRGGPPDPEGHEAALTQSFSFDPLERSADAVSAPPRAVPACTPEPQHPPKTAPTHTSSPHTPPPWLVVAAAMTAAACSSAHWRASRGRHAGQDARSPLAERPNSHTEQLPALLGGSGGVVPPLARSGKPPIGRIGVLSGLAGAAPPQTAGGAKRRRSPLRQRSPVRLARSPQRRPRTPHARIVVRAADAEARWLARHSCPAAAAGAAASPSRAPRYGFGRTNPGPAARGSSRTASPAPGRQPQAKRRRPLSAGSPSRLGSSPRRAALLQRSTPATDRGRPRCVSWSPQRTPAAIPRGHHMPRASSASPATRGYTTDTAHSASLRELRRQGCSRSASPSASARQAQRSNASGSPLRQPGRSCSPARQPGRSCSPQLLTCTTAGSPQRPRSARSPSPASRLPEQVPVRPPVQTPQRTPARPPQPPASIAQASANRLDASWAPASPHSGRRLPAAYPGPAAAADINRSKTPKPPAACPGPHEASLDWQLRDQVPASMLASAQVQAVTARSIPPEHTPLLAPIVIPTSTSSAARSTASGCVRAGAPRATTIRCAELHGAQESSQSRPGMPVLRPLPRSQHVREGPRSPPRDRCTVHASRQELRACINDARTLLSTPRTGARRSTDSPLALGAAVMPPQAGVWGSPGSTGHAGYQSCDSGIGSWGWASEAERMHGHLGPMGARSPRSPGAAQRPLSPRRGRRGKKGGCARVGTGTEQRRQQEMLVHAAQGLLPLEVAMGHEGPPGRCELRRRIAEVRDALQPRQ